MNFMKIMMIISILSICWWRKNIIMFLLSLELLLISMFMLMSNLPNSPISLLIMLLIMVSSSSIGLSMLVSLSHSHNSSNSIFINMMSYDKNNFF